MRNEVQKLLDELTAKGDNRLEVFDVRIEQLEGNELVLSGRLSNAQQLDTLNQITSERFPSLHVSAEPVRILERAEAERLHVATNLTGLHEKPSFGTPLASELYFGTELEILEEDGKWAFVRQSDGYLGWAYRPYLAPGTLPAPTHLVLAPAVELREEPKPEATILTRLVSGTGVTVVETRSDWACVKANETGWLPVALLRPIHHFPNSKEERQVTMIEDAMRMTGTPYLWGGTSGNGIDCSGLARLLHRWIGLEIPRDADLQHKEARPVEGPFEAGDLFFFGESDSHRKITHVGISTGGWKLIHSSRSRNGVYCDDLQENGSLMEIFVSAGSFIR